MVLVGALVGDPVGIEDVPPWLMASLAALVVMLASAFVSLVFAVTGGLV